jgi:hypothetical protein
MLTKIISELTVVLNQLAQFNEEAADANRAVLMTQSQIDESVVVDMRRVEYSAARIGQMIGYVFEQNAFGCRAVMCKIHRDHVELLSATCPAFIQWIA